MSLLLEIVKYLSNLSALPAIVIGRHQRGLLWYYAWVSFLADAASFILKHGFGIKHHVVNNAFLFFQFLLVSIFLCRAVFEKGMRAAAITGACLIAAYFALRTIIYYPSKTNFDDASLLYALLIMLGLFALYRVMRDIEYVRLEQSPLFTFASAFLLYTSGTLLLIMFDDHLIQHYSNEFVNQIWALNDPLNILKNFAIARVFFLHKTGTGADV